MFCGVLRSGELHYLSDAKEFHVEISCDVPLRPELTADARGPSVTQQPRNVIPSLRPLWADTARCFEPITAAHGRNSDIFLERFEFHQ